MGNTNTGNRPRTRLLWLADLTEPESVRKAVAEGVRALGRPVNAVIHGAGINHPKLLSQLAPEDIEATLGPKIDGLRNLLEATSGTPPLKLLVTF